MKTKYDEYIKIYKNYKNFEENKKLIWSRYYLDDYAFDKRVDFVLALIQNFVKKEFVMEIQFWEERQRMVDFFSQFKKTCSIIKEYDKGKKPGIIVLEDYCLDTCFFEQLLQNHYNHDFSYEPLMSIKILLFINQEDYLMIFDFYDDRGFIINYYYYQS